ncbi:MAG: dienelactone hydrolase family protein [Nitratireductor sp.]|nr:dienelactone hydrolase family protein [Nitratireductor sp.]
MNEHAPIAAGRMKASDFDPELLEIFDGYVHGRITKREFLKQAERFAVGGVTAAMLLSMLSPNYARARQVPEDDASVTSQWIEYESPNGHGTIKAYLSKPAGAEGKLPAVLVVHENRGLNPYIQDVNRRMAKAGFMALAPDGLSPKGGYPGNDDDGRAMQQELDPARLMEDFFAATQHLLDREDGTGKVGCVGFCYGGGVCNAIAVAFPELSASVPFYGRQPKAEDVTKIQAPLMLHYGALDERINAGWPAYEEALRANGKSFEAFIYEGVNHGFHNDTTPRYDEAAAKLAEERTIAFFRKHLA